MAGGITPEFLEEIKFKCDIVDVISQYVPLQKKGGRYFGCCPFHNEKTASFCVNQQSGYYHCFGCGESGDVVTFVMKMESITFIDAVKWLADKASLPMPEFKLDPSYTKKKEHGEVIKQLMRDVARYYRNNLLDEQKGAKAREYLVGRGITDEIAKRYGLGLSLDYDSMVGYMRRKGYLLRDLLECGLIASVEKPHDAFANRIIVPIMNSMSDVVAFGGRIYQGEQDVAKYKNSTNTTLFDKGRTIYGINFVKRDKKEFGAYSSLILVEGYMDVISLGAAGIRNVVAGMGTALTEGQAAEIKKLVQNVYVCYDGDSAGRKATLKNIEPLQKCGLEIKIVSLDDKKDPDETVRQVGYEGFMKKLDEALGVIEYKLKLCKDAANLDSVDGRAKYVQSAIKVLASIESDAQREVYMKVVADNANISVESLKSEIGSGARRTKRLSASVTPVDKGTKLLQYCRHILNRIMNNAKYANANALSEEWFSNDTHKKILQYAKGLDEQFSVGSMFSYIENNDEINRILDVTLNFADKSKEEEYYQGCVISVANEFLTKKIDSLTAHYNTLADKDEKRATLVELASLQKKIKSQNIQDKL